MTEIKLLSTIEGFEYRKLSLKKYQRYLFNCDKENVIALGASSGEGKPLGLALAFAIGEDGAPVNQSTDWVLCSIYVKEMHRGQGLGRGLWEALSEELKRRGARHVSFQSVLREIAEKDLTAFFEAAGFQKPKRVAKIFSYSSEKALGSSFVRASKEGILGQGGKFQMVSPKELPAKALEEMKENEGDWYPEFVSPFIGWGHISEDCTVFAIDSMTGKVAAWLTAMDVNDGTYLLYRTFFTREEYRDTAIGLYTFSEAVRRHFALCPEKMALASIPLDNERSMRFNELFFQGTQEHVSYEISTEYFLK